MQAESLGGCAELWVRGRHHICSDEYRSRQMNRVVGTQCLVLGEHPGRLDQIAGDVDDRQLIGYMIAKPVSMVSKKIIQPAPACSYPAASMFPPV